MSRPGWDPLQQYAPQILRGVQQFVRDRERLGPPITPDEKTTLETVRRDAVYAMVQNRDRSRFELSNHLKQVELKCLHQVRSIRQVIPSAIFGDGYRGYGNGWTGNKMRLLYSQDRKRAGRHASEIFLSIHLQNSTGYMDQELIPVRIEYDSDKHKLHDTFIYNAKDTTIPLELFVGNLLEDFCLPPGGTASIVQSIRSQVETQVNLPKVEFNPDVRFPIDLDITVGQHKYTDQIEWDLGATNNSPEEFAELTCAELGLPGEFATCIAFSIREQCQAYTSMLLQHGQGFGGREVKDETLVEAVCPTVDSRSFLRPPQLIPAFSPVLSQTEDFEFERQDHDRESRRRRRLGRTMRQPQAGHGPQPSSVSELRETSRVENTPAYNSILPGSVDRNLDILRMAVASVDSHETERDTLYYLGQQRRDKNIPSCSIYKDEDYERVRPKMLVKLKLPR